MPNRSKSRQPACPLADAAFRSRFSRFPKTKCNPGDRSGCETSHDWLEAVRASRLESRMATDFITRQPVRNQADEVLPTPLCKEAPRCAAGLRLSGVVQTGSGGVYPSLPALRPPWRDLPPFTGAYRHACRVQPQHQRTSVPPPTAAPTPIHNMQPGQPPTPTHPTEGKRCQCQDRLRAG